MARLSLRPPSVEVTDTGTRKGIGVYALRSFSQGDHVETCPVIVFSSDDFNALPKTLRERLFDWSKLITKPPGQHAMALGYGSVYNYSNPANLRYSAMRSTCTITFQAVRDIQMGEELTINYDEPSGFDPSPVSAWMSRQGITPV